jgi:hypothetical protein
MALRCSQADWVRSSPTKHLVAAGLSMYGAYFLFRRHARAASEDADSVVYIIPDMALN